MFMYSSYCWANRTSGSNRTAGPATISVGTTVTGDPGESASVTNSGTDTNAILDFVIPQGQKGNDGIGDTIFVRSTTTGEAGTEAKVIDNKVNNTHVLDFVIPKGPIGPCWTHII